MTPTVRRLLADMVTDAGWQSGTDLEDRVALRLHRWGHRPSDVAQQLRVGRYRVDFAWPAIQVALEADGWHHRSPEGTERDARRDAYLRSVGWLVFRVDDIDGEEGMTRQLARVSQVIRSLTS